MPTGASAYPHKISAKNVQSRGARDPACTVSRLLNRSDFLRLAKGRRVTMPGLVLQMSDTGGIAGKIRVGFTATKKIGNAVVRNKAKRRLREIARTLLPLYGRQSCDYVLIARQATPICAFATLVEELKRALLKIHPESQPLPGAQ